MNVCAIVLSVWLRETSVRFATTVAGTHLNKYYLAHTFQREYGISPITYLNRRRIEESKHMLGNTGYSLAQISELMGFSSPSYFSQCFRKAEGLTPNEYRRQVRQGQRPAPSKRHEA